MKTRGCVCIYSLTSMESSGNKEREETLGRNVHGFEVVEEIHEGLLVRQQIKGGVHHEREPACGILQGHDIHLQFPFSGVGAGIVDQEIGLELHDRVKVWVLPDP